MNKHYNFTKTTLLSGITWGIFHFPLLIIIVAPKLGVSIWPLIFFTLIRSIGLSGILAWLRLKYERYGLPEVLEVKEISKPAVKKDEVLIKVRAASVTPLDWHMLTGTPYIARLIAGLFKPKHQVL